MFITTPTIFLGKENLDAYINSLPLKETILSTERKIELALNAFELYNKGVPYSCRSTCLYYFYHFYPAEHQELSQDILEKWDILNYYADRSLRDKKILLYLEQLDPEKYFEVFQVRGIIESYNSGLEDYLDLVPDMEWWKIQERVLPFIESEPVCSHYLLEKMLSGLSKYYYDNHLKTSVRYKIAKRIWDCSTDINMLHSAWLCLNNPEDIFEYKKSTLPENEVIKLLKLEKLEKEIMSSFDENRLGWPGRRRMIARLFADDFCLAWLRLIDDNLSIFNNDDYVKGYAEFLRGYVCYVFGHLKRACKELLRAYYHQYNPVIALMYVVNILETLNKFNEAAEYAQQTVKLLAASKEDLLKEECLQKTARVLRRANKEPILANTIIQEKAKENESIRIKLFNSSINENIEATKKVSLEERVNRGIKLFDELIDAPKINLMLENPEQLEEVYIALPAAEIESLGLEEIELFNSNIENNDGYISSEITLSRLINYNIYLILKYYSRINYNFKVLIREFPNSLGCAFIAKEILQEMVSLGRIQDAFQMVLYLIARKGKNKVNGFYRIIEPLRMTLNERGNYSEEINLLTALKGKLSDKDQEKADNDLEIAEEMIRSKSYSLRAKNFVTNLKKRNHIIDRRIFAFNNQLAVADTAGRKYLMISGIIIIVISIILMILLSA